MILGIDQGTTGTTCLVFDAQGRPRGRAYSESRQHFSRPGWVEHDRRRSGTSRGASRPRHSTTPASAGTTWPGSGSRTNARRRSRRTANRSAGCTARSSGRTGARRAAATSCAPPGTSRCSASAPGSCSTQYFSGTKYEWLLRHGGVDPRAALGTIDSWLVYKLTGHHVSDYSNASRTLLFNIRERR
jgi:glycerol kinase